MSMSDFGERTEKPTDRRRREARARGEVARSRDLVAALVLLSAAAALWWAGPALMSELAGMMRGGLSSTPVPLDPQLAGTQLLRVATRLAAAGLPILLVILLAAAVGSLLQTGFLWVPTAVLPKAERLNPALAFGRWWTLAAWGDLFWSLVKLIVLLAVLLAYVRVRLVTAGPLVEGNPGAIIRVAAGLVGELAVVLSLSLVVLAVIDYVVQFWRQERRLMMTVEEVRREQRESEANPQQKRQQRELAAAYVPDATERGVEGIRAL